jgi:transposase-like protein
MLKTLDSQPEHCPRCKGLDLVKSGKHYDLKGIVQRYLCKTCGTTFCNDGYFRGRHQLSLLQYAVAQYQNGLSYEQIQAQIKDNFGIKISRTTIGEWLRHLGFKPRPKNSGDQKHKKNRELIQVGLILTVRFASSNVPEKFLVLENSIITN